MAMNDKRQQGDQRTEGDLQEKLVQVNRVAKTVNLTIGLSHQVDYQLAEGLSADTPSQTEIVISGIDKQAVGQAAAEIRSFRPPEPYKGKGIRYADEYVRRKEAKKK